MPNFVVAYISFHNNELEQTIVEADCPADAMFSVFLDKGWSFDEDDISFTEEELKGMAFNADSMISALEIPS